MKVWLIWAKDEGVLEHVWLVDAWDDETVAENGDGFKEKLAEVRKDHGVDNVVVTVTNVDIGKVYNAFEPVEV